VLGIEQVPKTLPGIKTRLEGTLHELLASDPHFAAELQKLLDAGKPAGIRQEVHADELEQPPAKSPFTFLYVNTLP